MANNGDSAGCRADADAGARAATSAYIRANFLFCTLTCAPVCGGAGGSGAGSVGVGVYADAGTGESNSTGVVV